MLWVPLAASILTAGVLAPRLVEDLRDRGLVRSNYRGATVACPSGIAIAATALVVLGPLAILNRLVGEEVFAPGFVAAFVYVVGVMLLGLVDDLLGSAADPAGDTDLPRGWRGHLGAAAAGRLSTGALKATGALGLAALVVAPLDDGGLSWRYVVGVLLLVLTTNLFNLLDLRPGRSVKVLLALAVGLLLATRELDPLWSVGLFLGPILVLLPLDLRERAMLGDTGSNAVGAVAGIWLVAALSPVAQVVALALVAGITLYAEFRSISALVEKTPLLRRLDSIGRAHA